MAGMMKHKKHRKFSQASMKQFIPPKLDDLFTTGKDTKAKKQQAPQLPGFHHEFKFTVGKKYYLIDKANPKSQDDEKHMFTYQGKQGKHHVFKHLLGGWITTRTDTQLIGKTIVEIKEKENISKSHVQTQEKKN